MFTSALKKYENTDTETLQKRENMQVFEEQPLSIKEKPL
jgi:hypothetical protein